MHSGVNHVQLLSSHVNERAPRTELLVRVLMHVEPEELSRCDQLCKLFHGPPSLIEQALRLLDSEGGLGGIPETLSNNHANWTQALLFLASLRRGSKYKLVAAGRWHSACVDDDVTRLNCGRRSPGFTAFGGAIDQCIPMPVAGLMGVRVQSAVAEISHIIALSVDGMAFSWGDYCYQPITANLGTVTERTLLYQRRSER